MTRRHFEETSGVRAAEMARIMVEEWSDEETAESFVLRRFAKDTISDLCRAVEIMAEIENADTASDDLNRWTTGW